MVKLKLSEGGEGTEQGRGAVVWSCVFLTQRSVRGARPFIHTYK